MEDLQACQFRSWATISPIVHLDAFRVKVRQDQSLRQLAVYLVLGVNTGGKQVLIMDVG